MATLKRLTVRGYKSIRELRNFELAGLNVLYLTLFDEVWTLGPGDNAPTSAKLVAASQVCLWVGVIYFGRMLPYIGNAF